MGGQTWYFEDDLPNTADPKENDGDWSPPRRQKYYSLES